MSYKIDGVDFLLKPEKAKWNFGKELATDGNNRNIYPAIAEIELYWSMMSTAQFNQIWSAWTGTSTTGTVAVDLPDPTWSSYAFKTYSGCVFTQPETEEYFEGHFVGVKALVRNVHVY